MYLEGSIPGGHHTWRAAYLEGSIPGGQHTWRTAYLEVEAAKSKYLSGTRRAAPTSRAATKVRERRERETTATEGREGGIAVIPSVPRHQHTVDSSYKWMSRRHGVLST